MARQESGGRRRSSAQRSGARQTPPPREEPVTDPETLERLARIEALAKAVGLQRGGRFRLEPLGMSPTWTFPEIQGVRHAALRGKPYPHEVTNLKTGTTGVVRAPLVEAATTAARPSQRKRGRPRHAGTQMWREYRSTPTGKADLAAKRHALLFTKFSKLQVSDRIVSRWLKSEKTRPRSPKRRR